MSEGSIDGVPYEVYDLTGLTHEDFVPGFYYSAGENDENSDEPDTKSVMLEGPYATKQEAVEAAHKFILDTLADLNAADSAVLDFEEKRQARIAEIRASAHPDSFARKCKRLRPDGPTPCLCCENECVG